MTTSPAHLLDVQLAGPGFGRVVTLLHMDVAPLNLAPNAPHTTTAGIFKTYPPAQYRSKPPQCYVQRLVPLKGYTVPPDGEARILILLQAAALGHFIVNQHIVTYEENGFPSQQILPVGVKGSVSNTAKVLPPDRSEVPCIGKGGVRLLPSPS
jgi:hypothetical protein